MAQYDTVVKQVTDDITVTISKKKDGSAGDRLVAFLKWLSEKVVDPDYGVGEGRPDQGLPGGGRPPGKPDQGLPGEGGRPPRPDQGLPPQGGGGRPDQGLPGGGGGGGERPDNSLPPILGENADKIAKIILASCFDCKPKPDQGLPEGGSGAQPKR